VAQPLEKGVANKMFIKL